MDSKAAKRAALETDTHPFDTQEAIPGLLNDIVISHILSDDSLLDPRDLARLRAVSWGMRNAVAGTGLHVKLNVSEG